MHRQLLCACAMTLLVATAAASTRTWHVPGDLPTIAAGLDAAAIGDTVLVACGTYHEHGLLLKDGVTLRSQTGEPECVTIDGQDMHSVVICEDVAVPAVIEGFTLTHGQGQGTYPSGGGLVCRNSTLAIRRCRFVDNAAGWGGGLYAWESRIDVVDCTFVGNRSDVGAAGIDCTGGFPRFTRCEVVGNTGVGSSAAVRTAHTDATFTDCLIAGNDLPAGGAVFVGLDSRLTLDNCTLADQPQVAIVGLQLQNAVVHGMGNVLVGVGGTGIAVDYESTLDLAHTTVAGCGAGLAVSEGSSATLHACLVAFNAGAGITTLGADAAVACSNTFANAGGNYAGELADLTGVAGNISADPLFCDLASGDVSVQSASPALPSGNLCFVQMGAHGQGCQVTAAPDTQAAVARLLPARPNPFNPRTTLRFSLAAETTVRLDIVALDGTRVATLLHGWRAAGAHEVTWHGRNAQGREAPAGIYLGRLVAGDAVSVQRLVLVR